MGAVNYGVQEKSFDYKALGKASVFNLINYKLHNPGVYHGFNVLKIDNSNISISTGTCFIEDQVKGLGVRIRTTEARTIGVSTTNVFVILRMTWNDALSNNYMDMLAVPFADIIASDIILARCVYVGSNLSTEFDLSLRNDSVIKTTRDTNDELKITATEPYSSQVNISAGYYYIDDTEYYFAGGSVTALPEVTQGMLSYIVVNTAGTVSAINSSDITTPVKPNIPSNVYVIGYLLRIGATTVVGGKQIFQIKNTPTSISKSDVVATYLPLAGGTLTGTLTTRAITSSAGAYNINFGASTGTFATSSGTNTINGNLTVVNGKKVGIGQAVGTEVLEVTGNIKTIGNITSSGSIGASISSTTNTGVVTTNHLFQVNASTNSTAGGDRSQVNASYKSTASENISQVNASESSIASGAISQVNASYKSTASGNISQVNASERTTNSTYHSTAWGYASSGEPSEDNQTIRLESNGGHAFFKGKVRIGENSITSPSSQSEALKVNGDSVFKGSVKADAMYRLGNRDTISIDVYHNVTKLIEKGSWLITNFIHNGASTFYIEGYNGSSWVPFLSGTTISTYIRTFFTSDGINVRCRRTDDSGGTVQLELTRM